MQHDGDCVTRIFSTLEGWEGKVCFKYFISHFLHDFKQAQLQSIHFVIYSGSTKLKIFDKSKFCGIKVLLNFFVEKSISHLMPSSMCVRVILRKQTKSKRLKRIKERS
jgi:hypothetical protein